jgi:hypothetical protein
VNTLPKHVLDSDFTGPVHFDQELARLVIEAMDLQSPERAREVRSIIQAQYLGLDKLRVLQEQNAIERAAEAMEETAKTLSNLVADQNMVIGRIEAVANAGLAEASATRKDLTSEQRDHLKDLNESTSGRQQLLLSLAGWVKTTYFGVTFVLVALALFVSQLHQQPALVELGPLKLKLGPAAMHESGSTNEPSSTPAPREPGLGTSSGTAPDPQP